jgi:hypothetical protein
MKSFFTKMTVSMAFLLLIAVFNLNAADKDSEIRKDLKERLPYLMGSNNAGTLFYLAFHPCWETNSSGNALRIYISSAVATTVTLEIKGLGIFRQKMTVPNDVIDFMLTPSEGQPYTKTDQVKPLPEQIWEGRAIKITSEDPIIVYGVTRFYATSDGYLALPASSLGNNYQVSSYADPTNNSFQWLPSFTSIIGTYDNTRVTFKMGGCESCFALKEDGEYLKFNQTIRRTLNEGDVWLIPGIGPFNDLTGSTVKANKPINVISGNFCAYIPSHIAACDFIIEQEMPENVWGKKYHVTPIATRKAYSIIKLFAKKPFTQVYSDGLPAWYIQTPGGIAGTGHIETRAGVMNPGDLAPKPVEISSNEAINVVQFNPGSQDDGVENDPFQLVLTPSQQYQKEIVFNTPGIRGSYGFKTNFVNIVYLATAEGGIPDDMMWAEVVDGKFNWIQLSAYSGNPGQRFFTTEPNGRHYRAKTIKLQYDGVYRIKANDPFAAYAYGSDYYDSYGFPTSVALADLETPDSLAPYLEFSKECTGEVAGLVIDEPRIDPENRSNLGLIYMMTDDSYNFKFEIDPFIAGIDARTDWRLKVRNAALNARAHLVFTDRVGNRKDTVITHYSISPNLFPYYSDYGTFKIETPNIEKSVEFTIKNEGDNAITSQYEIYVVLDSDIDQGKAGDIVTYQDFDLLGVKGQNLSPLAIGQERKFNVKFTARAEGTYRDSVGVVVVDKSTGDTCVHQYFALVEAFVGNPYIDATDKNFYEQVVNSRTAKFDLTVSNPINTGSCNQKATTSLKITGIKMTGDEIGNVGSGSVFEVDGLDNISVTNPLIIAPGASKTFSVSFMPKAVRDYKSLITFEGDATVCKNFSVIEGRGIQPGLLVNGDDWGERLVDPNSYIKKGGTYTYSAYPSVSKAITLSNDGSATVTLGIPQVVGTPKNGEGFKAEINGNLVSLTAAGTLQALFANKQVKAGETLTIPVFFDPKVSGEHELVLNFPSDATSSPTSVLKGIGVYPTSETANINFGHSIVGTGVKNDKVDFKAITWTYDYPVTITDFVAAPASEISDFSGNATFKWDRNSIKDKNGVVVTLPHTLQPGDYLTVAGQYLPTQAGSFTATLTTVSDAEVEAVSTWTGTAEVEGSVMTPDTRRTCLSVPVTLRPTIENNGTNDFNVTSVVITNPNNVPNFNPLDFKIDPQFQNFTVGAKGKQNSKVEIPIVFTPSTNYNNATFRVTVKTSSATKNEDFTTITVTSTHVVQSSFSTVGANNAKHVVVDPGQGDAVPYTIYLNTSNAAGPDDNTFTFQVKVSYSKDFLGIGYTDRTNNVAKIQVSQKLADMGWSLAGGKPVTSFDQTTNKETLTLTFSGGTPFNGNYGTIPLATVVFDAYLPWYKDSEGNVKVKSDTTTIEHVILNNSTCVSYTQESSTSSLNPTCVDNLRPIQISASKYGLKPIAPNPVGSNGADVNFSVGGNNIFTEVKIYNSNSELVTTVFSGTLNPGSYSARIPVENLSSGMYFIEMTSGPFKSNYEKLIINK